MESSSNEDESASLFIVSRLASWPCHGVLRIPQHWAVKRKAENLAFLDLRVRPFQACIDDQKGF